MAATLFLSFFKVDGVDSSPGLCDVRQSSQFLYLSFLFCKMEIIDPISKSMIVNIKHLLHSGPYIYITSNSYDNPESRFVHFTEGEK